MKKTLLLLCLTFSLSIHAQHHIKATSGAPVDFRCMNVRPSCKKASPARVEGLSSLQRAVGYIVDSNPDSITMSGALVGTAGTYPLGVIVTADMLRDYVGCKVIGIRVAAAQSLGKSDVWLHPISNEGVVSDDGLSKGQRLYEGWNNVFFNGDASWEIKEGEMLLVGFDYNETESMVAADVGGICTVGEAQGNDFLIYTDVGDGMGWYSVGNLGSLCVQLIVDISNLPEKMLSLTYLDTGFRYKKADEKIEMYTIASNIGRNSLSGYTIRCRIDDQDPVNFTYDKTLAEAANDHQQPVLALPAGIAVGTHQLCVELLAEDDAAPVSGKASKTVTFYIYNESLQRQQNYVEQYNSQNEYMASVVNPIFNQVAQTDNSMALVNVYTSDSPLAIEESGYLPALYAYTVPSFTINRSYFPGEEYIAYDVNFYASQYPDFVPSIVHDLMAQDMLQPSFATINITPNYDADSKQLSIDVTGQLAEGAADIFKDLSLTLLLTEDNVTGDQVVVNPFTGRLTTRHDYLHQHVLRKYVTSPLGAPVSVSGNGYTAHHTVTLDGNWDIDQMTVVGFLCRGAETVTDDNVKEMDVTNCCSMPLKGITGIHQLDNNAKVNTTSQYFTLDGQKVASDNLLPGIYIVKKEGKCSKIIVK